MALEKESNDLPEEVIMGSLPQVTTRKLKRMEPEEMRRLPSVEVTDESGDFIGFLIVPPRTGGMSIWDDIKNNGETLGVRANIVVPNRLIRALNDPESWIAEKYPALAKARAAKAANQEKQKQGVKV